MSNYRKPVGKNWLKASVSIAVFLAVLGLAGIYLLVTYWYIWVALLVAGLIILVSWHTKTNPHKILTILVALNIVLDIIAIAIWAIFPATQWSIYQLGFSIVGTEAAFAAILFAVTLFGLIKSQKWASFLAIAITATQRGFGTYVFFPSTALAVTLIWSLLIVYFASRDIKSNDFQQLAFSSGANCSLNCDSDVGAGDGN